MTQLSGWVSTPLADEIAALRAEVVSLRAHQAAIEAALEPSSNIETTLGGRVKALRARVAYLEGELHETIGENADLVVRAERAEAERDALKSRLYGPLTAEEYARLTALESLTETEARQAMASGVSADKLGTFLGRVYKTVGERDALRAQLLSERERLERWLTAPDGKQYERGTVQAVFDECDALRAQQVDLLDAMDKSKP